MNSGKTPINTRAVCGNDSAYVFIGANEDLWGVKCVALDKEFFDNPEIVLGDLSLNDEDVCRFRLLRNTTEPRALRCGITIKSRGRSVSGSIIPGMLINSLKGY